MSTDGDRTALLGLPAVPAGWGYALLKDYLVDGAASYGVVQPGADDPNGVPILRVGNLRDGRIVADTRLRISPEVERMYARTRLQGGEVLLSLVGSVGEVSVVPADYAGWNVARAIAVLRPREPKEAEWLKYCLQAPVAQRRMHVWQTTTVQATLNLKDVKRLPVVVPPPSEQSSIAAALGALDDRIEAIRHIQELCWQYAEAAFDREDRNAEDRVPLGSVLDLAYGKGLPARSRRVGRIPVFGSGGSVGWHDTALVTGPGVVVGRKGTVGSVQWSQSDFFPIDTTFYVANAKMPMVYAHQLLRSLGLENMNSDSAVPGLNRSAALARIVGVPSESRLTAFRDQVEPLVRLSEHLRRETAALGALRDTLLPELLSGRIRVRDIPNCDEELPA